MGEGHAEDTAGDGEDLVGDGREARKEAEGPAPFSVPSDEAGEFLLGETWYEGEEKALENFPAEGPDGVARGPAEDGGNRTDEGELERLAEGA